MDPTWFLIGLLIGWPLGTWLANKVYDFTQRKENN